MDMEAKDVCGQQQLEDIEEPAVELGVMAKEFVELFA